MANEKILDMTKSAAANETAVNNKFDELSQQGGGDGNHHTDPVQGYLLGNNFGGNVDCNNFALGDALAIVNSVLMQRSLKDSKVKLAPLNDGGNEAYAHGSNVAVLNGKAYVVCFFNTRSTVDEFEYKSTGDARIALFIFDLATWAIDKVTVNGVQKNYYEVAQHGDAISNGNYIASGCGDPIVFASGNTVTVAWTCRMSASASDAAPTGSYCMLYRDYNISDGTWGNINPCLFKESTSATPVEMTHTNFMSALGLTSWSQWFNMFSQYAEYQPTYKDANNQTVTLPKEYYVAVASNTSIPNGVIVRTQDFHTFTYWIKPVFSEFSPINLKYEMALTTVRVPGEPSYRLKCAARTASETQMFIGTIRFDTYNTDGTVAQVGYAETDPSNPGKVCRMIPDGGSRPCFFHLFNENWLTYIVYLNHMTDIGSRSRRWTSVEVVGTNFMTAAYLSRIATTTQMTYPSITQATINGKNWYIVTYTCEDRIYIGKFGSMKSFNDVIPMLAKMIDTFGEEIS